MFDFEKLEVYQKAHDLALMILGILYREKNIDPYMRDQLKRASLGVVLNIAEGTGRVSGADKKHFYTIARGSVFECVSIVKVLCDLEILSKNQYNHLYYGYEEISKMLLALFRSIK
ncbi:four helix bundle protein [Fulvivirgaceae bacterium BMA12]|uniref:Four helix bundle protein n=1 Tax=Agaribacillus aureus TaxID=3051825 RepID=A0ABT8LKL0_9BACT|nr:four helix bundle protein [Fulvivirgaceae bacterium BMA12]